MAVQQRQHVGEVRCRTFIGGLISMSLVFCKFVESAASFVMGGGALHPPCLWPGRVLTLKQHVRRDVHIIHSKQLWLCRPDVNTTLSSKSDVI